MCATANLSSEVSLTEKGKPTPAYSISNIKNNYKKYLNITTVCKKMCLTDISGIKKIEYTLKFVI